MARPREVVNGRVQGYYVQPHHETALAVFAKRRGHSSASKALREILDEVAAVEGVPVPVPVLKKKETRS